MFELGKKDKCFGTDDPTIFRPLNLAEMWNPTARPSQKPILPEGWDVVAGYDQGLGERLIVCESLEDMQTLHDAYARGGAINLNWYAGFDVGFVTAISGGK
jgi:hypothetical protein